MSTLRLLACAAGLAALALPVPAPVLGEGAHSDVALLNLPLLPANAVLGARAEQIARALTVDVTPGSAWTDPRVHKTRGAAGALYSRLAPSTVIVRTPRGHGSGVVIDPSGWVLTNAHCVEQGSTQAGTGALQVLVHVGRMHGDLMQLDADGVPGIVHKVDTEKDLALVKLTRLPAGVTQLPAVELALDEPRPGSDCVVLGHPAAGMLWTVRSCEVAGVGTWPSEQIDFVFQRLRATSPEDHRKLEEVVAQIAPVKILLSSCGLNPGDSGGPLVDKTGKLIALTFAIPASERYDKFAYHVHLDEIRTFLAHRPATPPIHVPNAWPPAAYTAAMDLDRNGRAETVLFGLEPGGPPTGMLSDLDESFLGNFTPEQLAQAGKDFDWDFEFGWQSAPEGRAFYDSNNDGEFDMVHIDLDRNGSSEVVLKKNAEVWGYENGGGSAIVDVTRLPEAMRDRGLRIVMALSRKPDAPEPEAAVKRGH